MHPLECRFVYQWNLSPNSNIVLTFNRHWWMFQQPVPKWSFLYWSHRLFHPAVVSPDSMGSYVTKVYACSITKLLYLNLWHNKGSCEYISLSIGKKNAYSKMYFLCNLILPTRSSDPCQNVFFVLCMSSTPSTCNWPAGFNGNDFFVGLFVACQHKIKV